VAIAMNLFRSGTVSFTDWLDPSVTNTLVLAHIAVILCFGIDCPVCDLPDGMAQTHDPKIAAPSSRIHPSLPVQDALSSQQLNRRLARGMWMDLLLREHWRREGDDRGSEEREMFHDFVTA
jgi:hypothetical protein